MGKAFSLAPDLPAEPMLPRAAHRPAPPDPKSAVVAPELSIIIPTLNASAFLSDTFHALLEATESIRSEVIVVDGGSSDDTVAKAQALGAKVITANRGRGSQLSAGAKEATGRWLLFLHADTTLEPFWSTTVTSFIRSKANALKAAHFVLALDDASNAARRIEELANWRSRRLGLPYGDQGLLMSRALYNTLVGFLDIPIMEDVDMVRRIGRRNLVELPATATTSAQRYRKDGFWLRPLRNLTILCLYFLGVPPRRLARLYG
jgi:rSAM/selenodomain-associated transferase 2